MLEITCKNIKTWSRLGPRATYGMALTDAMGEDDRILALSADLGQSSGLTRLMKTDPGRYINVGIAEQNLIGVASGMAKAGFIPFASSFAPFITLRCADQIRMNMGYMNLNVKIAGLGSGCSMGYLGYSHYGMEDIAFLRSIPNMAILSPADCGQLVSAVRAAIKHEGPVYIRLTGEPGMPVVYQDSNSMAIGGANIVKEGSDVVFVATGSMVSAAIRAGQFLEEDGICSHIIDMYCLKPINKEVLDNLPNAVKLIVTLEEHSSIGGLGSAVAEHLSDRGNHVPILRIGIPEEYVKVGGYGYMLEQCGLTPELIVERTRKRMREL